MAYPRLSENKKIHDETNHQNPIIKGKFHKKTVKYPEPAVFRINIMLSISLVIAVLISMVSYLGVIAKESEIKDLHHSTNKINHENIELKNQVEYLKSFYTIGNNVQKVDFLKKANEFLEVSKKYKEPVFSVNMDFFDITTEPGY